MNQREARVRRRDKKNKAGLILGAIGVVIIAGVVWLNVVQNFNSRELDRTTGCPKNGYDSVTAVLIDLTDPISPIQSAALRNALLKIKSEIPKFGRLEIYPLKSITRSALEPIFTGCNPGRGVDVDSSIYGNPELADRRWRKQFADKVDSVVAEVQDIQPQDNSAVLEGIQSVGVTAFGSPSANLASDKRLVIISDMIHHTRELSMYQGAPAFLSFKETQYYLRIKQSLRGAKVDVFLIVRDTRRNVQQPPLYKFWVELIASSNGFLRNWEPLQ